MITLAPDARYVALAHGKLNLHDAKTAVALLRYRPESVVAVIDRENAGKTVEQHLGFGGPTPIVATLEEALEHGPDHLLIATALAGGKLSDEWRAQLVHALEHDLHLVSGLHWMLSEDPELVEAAARRDRRLVDLRWVPPGLSVPNFEREGVTAPVMLTVGSDCNAGKMTATWEIHRRAEAEGEASQFVATGQTGVLLAGWGLAVDRVISDFVAGASEQLVVEAARRGPGMILVEGQGSLVHPFFSGVTLGLLHGVQPDAMILCHVCGRQTVRHCPNQPVPPLSRLVEIYEEAAGWLRPAPVVGISLATYALDEQEARRTIDAATEETGLPAEDPVRFPTGALLEVLRTSFAGRTAGASRG